MIEIRHAKPEELDEMLTVMTTAFGVPKELWEAGFYTYPHDDIRNKQIVIVDGRIVSCLEYIPAEIYLGGSTVRMAGIAGVATLPDERKHGYAGMLMEYSISTMRELGYATSALYPFSFRWYRKYGWEFANQYLIFTTKPDNLPPYHEAAQVRPYRDDDLPALMRLYDEHHSSRVGPFVRNEREWREHILPKYKKVHVYDSAGVQGYLIAGVGEDQDSARFHVKEILAGSEESRRGLIGFLGLLHPDYKTVELITSDFDLRQLRLFPPRADWEEGYESQADVRLRPGFMFRILDLKGALKSLVLRTPDFNGELAIHLSDELAPWNEEPVLIAGRGVPEVTPGDSPNWIKADVRVLSQLYVGFMSASQAYSLGKIETSSPEALALAERLFPESEPFIPAVNEF
jgi:predicted acetyltransferase